ncbi:nucleotidyltransferase [Weissella coleopterorum]|uniref:tRNA(Met) cytidine acetate ligase n=1 Tax=Weissella coleopterorum TaxID=2714949 RepID=A0A6G8B1J3_9LACO|nr:nucleotidyltransferase [Weissella coleopterorum]QIL51003.1 nucleotidyltransferase [Weissella coleopterorum]
MRAVGLITEYNPFHAGHEYHLAQAKALSGADIAIVVMSGNFVQRGIPAMYDKWKRAKMAVQNGVDLVIELPVAFSIQPGPFFAKGAVEILLAAGVDTIIFGAEHAEWNFMKLAEQVRESTQQAAEFHNYKQTFASNFNAVLLDELGISIQDPNDLLGLSYALAVLELGAQDQVMIRAIQRKGQAYHSTQISQESFVSASGIRNALKNKSMQTKVLHSLPIGTQSLLLEPPFLDYEQPMWQLLYYKVMTTPVEQLEKIYQLNDGLAYRLLDIIGHSPSGHQVDWNTFMQCFKSKRYTYSRLQRSILYTLLNVSEAEMQIALQKPYLRVLAFNSKGQLWLKHQRKDFNLPVISKVNQNNLQEYLKLDLRAGRLYNILNNRGDNMPQDTNRQPYRLPKPSPERNENDEMEF